MAKRGHRGGGRGEGFSFEDEDAEKRAGRSGGKGGEGGEEEFEEGGVERIRRRGGEEEGGREERGAKKKRTAARKKARETAGLAETTWRPFERAPALASLRKELKGAGETAPPPPAGEEKKRGRRRAKSKQLKPEWKQFGRPKRRPKRKD